MGIGHLAVGFAARRAAPAVPLAVLLLAATLLDVLLGAFLLLGLEHARIVPGVTAASPIDLYDYPFSHSLVAAALWSVLFAALFSLYRRNRGAALIAAACVLSHWVLDVISHRPDVPVALHGPFLGLGLWNSVPATIVVEEGMLAAGVVLYLRGTTAKNRGGTWGLGALVALMAVLGAAGYLGPPPPNITPVAVANVASVLLLLVVHAVDRQRTAAGVVPPAPPAATH